MKQIIEAAAFIIVLSTTSAVTAQTTTITFGTQSRDIGNIGPIAENGYTYNAVGNSWQLINATLGGFVGDGNALVTYWGIPPALGNTITFERAAHGDFLWQSFDLEGRLQNQRNDVVLAQGFLSGVQVASQTLQSSNAFWQLETTAPAFNNPVDSLRFTVVELNGATLMFDNMTFTAVPEPGAGLFLILGVTASAALRREKLAPPRRSR
jgi:hypothetical protein